MYVCRFDGCTFGENAGLDVSVIAPGDNSVFYNVSAPRAQPVPTHANMKDLQVT